MGAVAMLEHKDQKLLAGVARELLLREPYDDFSPASFVTVLKACAALDVYEQALLDVLCQFFFKVPTVVAVEEVHRSKQQRRAEIADSIATRRVKGVNLKAVGEEGVEQLAPVGGGVTKRWLEGSARVGESKARGGEGDSPGAVRGRGKRQENKSWDHQWEGTRSSDHDCVRASMRDEGRG